MDFFEYIKDGFIGFVTSVLNALPKSPIVYLSSNADVKRVLGYVNFFVPVYTIVGLLEGWLIAIGMYYLLQVILRWLKVVE